MPERRIKTIMLLCIMSAFCLFFVSVSSAAVRNIKDSDGGGYGKDVRGGTQFDQEFSKKGGTCSGYISIDTDIQKGIGKTCGGKWESYQCRTDLKSCPSPQEGDGKSCGGSYQGCKCPSDYTFTCSGSDKVITSPCTINGVTKTKPANCNCNTTNFPHNAGNCASPKVLGGNSCTNGLGVENRQTCTCPAEYTTCSTSPDTSRSGYKSCTDASGTKHNYCKCPSTYKVCSANQTTGGATCSDSEGTKYSACACNSTFKLCSVGSIGSGAPCSDTAGTKYTLCKCPAGKLDLDTYYCNGALRCLLKP